MHTVRLAVHLPAALRASIHRMRRNSESVAAAQPPPSSLCMRALARTADQRGNKRKGGVASREPPTN